MQFPMTLRMLVVALLSVRAIASEGGSPLGKVIELLDNLKGKCEEEVQEEKLQWAKFSQFCGDTLALKKKEIDEGADKIDKLKADIEKASTSAQQLDMELKDHEATLEQLALEKENATQVREADAEDYRVLHKDLSESVDALDRAIKVLKKQDYDRAQNKTEERDENASFNAWKAEQASGGFVQISHRAAAVADVSLAELNRAGRALAYAASLESSLPTPPPAADAYEFQSGGVIKMLEGLQEKFAKQKKDTEDAETQKRYNHEMLIASLQIEIDANTKSKVKKTSFKAKRLADKVAGEEALAETVEAKDADQKFSDDLTTECQVKASDFKERQKIRQQEIDAIEQAKKVLRGAMKIGQEDAFYQVKAASDTSALALLRTESVKGVRKTEAVLRFLQERNVEIKSRSLKRLLASAEQKLQEAPATHKGAMMNIAVMLKDLLHKLEEEHTKEAELKGWCNEELGTNKLTREDKTQTSEEMRADIEMLETSIAKRTEDNDILASEIVKLDSEMVEAGNIREQEKAKNTKLVEDTEKALAAIKSAMIVLRDFYEVQGPALLQIRAQHSQKPEFEYGSTVGDAGQSNIIGLIETVIADMTQDVEDTKAAEDNAYVQYRQFISDCKADKIAKATTTKRNEMKMMQSTQDLNDRKRDLDSTEKQLNAALEYFEELKPKCINTQLSYEEEKKRRSETIESLQKALEMLSDTPAA